jgi:sensor histidine kinase YesM
MGNFVSKKCLVLFFTDNEDSNEHETSLKTLENRWQNLHKQILKCEKDIEQSIVNNELQELTKIRNEYQIWLDATPTADFKSELQV